MAQSSGRNTVLNRLRKGLINNEWPSTVCVFFLREVDQIRSLACSKVVMLL